MSQPRRAIGFLLFCLVVLTFGQSALAGPSVKVLGSRLKSASDFRVRTQAALALGASGKKSAVKALCRGLKDVNTTVRAASAAALGKLALGGRKCLSARLQREANTEVQSVLRRALKRIPAPGPKVGVDTELLVLVGKVRNNTSRSDASMSRIMGSALKASFAQASGVALAMEDQDATAAKKALKRYSKLKALLLLPKVELRYSGGSLKLKLQVSVFTYPDKALKGTLSKSLTMPDTPSEDRAAEDELIEMAAELLVPLVRQTAARI